MTLAATIRTARQSAGLTQHELAELVCCSRSYVALWETGRRRPPADVCRLLERVLGLNDAALKVQRFELD